MPQTDLFPPDYQTARSRFRLAAEKAGARLESWPVGSPGDDLTIDVARLGPEDAPGLVLLSSGLHGVEAPLGSALQSSWLEGEGPQSLPDGVGVLLLHALNPFGFKFGRRFDAQNIDLNRNFLLPEERYEGSPSLYPRLDPLLNSPRAPGMRDRLLFIPWAAWVIVRFGVREAKQAIAVGQYDFPLGLFFGGKGPSETFRILDAQLPPLIEPARRVVHLDIHTGLGPRGTFVLLVENPADTPGTKRLIQAFGADRVEPPSSNGTSYPARGTLGEWCSSRFGTEDRTFDYSCVEFGTYPALKVVACAPAGEPDLPLLPAQLPRLPALPGPTLRGLHPPRPLLAAPGPEPGPRPPASRH